MKKSSLKLVLFLVIPIAMMILFSTSAVAEDQIEWTDLSNGLLQAEAQEKKVFLFFYADWCLYCEKMKQTTFKNTKVIEYLNKNFISIAVNADKEYDMMYAMESVTNQASHASNSNSNNSRHHV